MAENSKIEWTTNGGTMSEQHTIEQLQAMPDEQLAEIAARLRWDDGFTPQTWNPAADDAQALGLLRWARDTQRLHFIVSVLEPADSDVMFCGYGALWGSVPGNDARAMTIAFVLAMEAKQ